MFWGLCAVWLTRFSLQSGVFVKFFIPIGCNCVVVLVPDVTCLYGFLFRNHRVTAIFFRSGLYLNRYIFYIPPGGGGGKV
jgi:hypothetical protein